MYELRIIFIIQNKLNLSHTYIFMFTYVIRYIRYSRGLHECRVCMVQVADCHTYATPVLECRRSTCTCWLLKIAWLTTPLSESYGLTTAFRTYRNVRDMITRSTHFQPRWILNSREYLCINFQIIDFYDHWLCVCIDDYYIISVIDHLKCHQ